MAFGRVFAFDDAETIGFGVSFAGALPQVTLSTRELGASDFQCLFGCSRAYCIAHIQSPVFLSLAPALAQPRRLAQLWKRQSADCGP
jgi:hypothetical protein